MADTRAKSRKELGRLFRGCRDLRTVAVNKIIDPTWFKFFQDEGWRSADDAFLVLLRGYPRIDDLMRARTVISDQQGAKEVVDALRDIQGRAGQILELATSELGNARALEAELDRIGKEHVFNDSSVPSIECHDQNEHREGVNFLDRVIVECLPHSADANLQKAKACNCWKDLPGLVGLRLCLHAMRGC